MSAGRGLHVHFDAVGGVAGDMIVAALLDARPDLRPRVEADLAATLPPDAGRGRLTEGLSGGLRALRFRLDGEPLPPGVHGGPAGSYRDMAGRIDASALSEGTAAHASAILRIIAEAESRLHGVPVDDVHFHEIADWDSLADVVAVGSLAAALDGARYSVSELPLGSGLVRTQHGLLPVPAPATAEILRGFRWRDDGIPGERVTPTGAACLRHLAGAEPGAIPCGRLVAVGTGAGTRECPGLPNVLRVLLLEDGGPRPAWLPDTICVLECDIDDMTGEEIAVAADLLRATDGVLDLTIGTRAGKKGRLVHDVRLMVVPEAASRVAEACFAQTSTLGLRWRREQRWILPRRQEREEATGLPVKIALRPGGAHTAKVEVSALDGSDLASRRLQARRAEDR